MRDPRRDPQAGDVLRKWSATRHVARTITDRQPEAVTYTNNSGKTFTTPLRKWVEWAQDARVEKVAATTTPKTP